MDSKTQHRSKLGTKATLLLCACDSNALGSEMTPILAVIALAFPAENVNLPVVRPPLRIILPTSSSCWSHACSSG